MLVNIAKTKLSNALFNPAFNLTVGLYSANANTGAYELTQMSDLTQCTFAGYASIDLSVLTVPGPVLDSHEQGYTLSPLVSFIASGGISGPQTIKGIFLVWRPVPMAAFELLFISPLSPPVSVASPGDGITFKVDLDVQNLNVVLPH